MRLFMSFTLLVSLFTRDQFKYGRREGEREGGNEGGAKKRTRKEGRVLKMSQKLNTEYRGVNIYETTPEKGQRSILQKGRRGQHKVN